MNISKTSLFYDIVANVPKECLFLHPFAIFTFFLFLNGTPHHTGPCFNPSMTPVIDSEAGVEHVRCKPRNGCRTPVPVGCTKRHTVHCCISIQPFFEHFSTFPHSTTNREGLGLPFLETNYTDFSLALSLKMVSKKVEERRRRQQEASQGSGVPSDLRRAGVGAGVFGVGLVVVMVAAFISADGEETNYNHVDAETRESFEAYPGKAKLRSSNEIGLIYRKGWGYALQAQMNVSENSQLLSIPPSAALTTHDALMVAPIRNVMDRYQLDIEKYLKNEFLFHQFTLVLSLLHEKYRENSSFAAWLDILPRKTRNDIFWTYEEVSCLPPVPKKAVLRRRETVGEISTMIRTYFKKGFWAEVTEADIQWAYSTVISRAWWREVDGDEGLAIYPVFDVSDARARHWGEGVWRPLEVNAKITVADDGTAHLVTSSALRKGDFVSTSPLVPLLPSDAAPMFGVIDPDFPLAVTHLDLSSFDAQNCTQDKLLVWHNGTLADQTIDCLLRYRDIPDHAPEEVKHKTLRNFASVHSQVMLKDWTLPTSGSCSATELGRRENGAEVLSLITSHVEAYSRMRDVYKKR